MNLNSITNSPTIKINPKEGERKKIRKVALLFVLAENLI